MRKLVGLINQDNLWNRMMAIDLETDVRDGNFLSNERILGIGIAFFADSDNVETRIFKLKEETDSSEIEMLQEFDNFLAVMKPLALTGYFFRQYDMPLLAIKRDYYRKKENGLPLWKIGNLLDVTLQIELSNQVKFLLYKKYNEKLRYRSFLEVIQNEHFQNLNLLKAKEKVPNEFGQKGEFIYNLWKNKDPLFEEYLKSDVHNALLIAKEMF